MLKLKKEEIARAITFCGYSLSQEPKKYSRQNSTAYSSRKEAIEQRALSEASRLKVMLLLAVQDNIMLTDAEENLAAEAQREFYQGLTGAEKDYLGIEEDRLRRLFEQYALAQKVYKSVGTSFEERYDSFCTTLDYDLNEKLWNTVALAEIDDLTQTPGFSEVYVKYFGNSDLGADTAVRESSDKNKK